MLISSVTSPHQPLSGTSIAVVTAAAVAAAIPIPLIGKQQAQR